jgi:hypothetical protein
VVKNVRQDFQRAIYGVAGSVCDSSNMLSLEPLVGVIHELPLPKVSYLNPATPNLDIEQPNKII